MSFDSSRLIFIVGHYKSGSSWLLNLLSLHPAIRGVQETHIFHHLRATPDLRKCTRTLYTAVPWSGGGLRHLPRHVLLAHFGRFLGHGRPLLSLSVQDRPMTRLDLPLHGQLALHRQLNSSSSVCEYCWRFFSFLWSHLQPERYLLEKTPSNIRYLGDIVQIFPQARLLAIHRDGRDVVVSDRSFRGNYRRSSDWTFRQSALRWREDMDAQFRACRIADLYTLSYEDLVQDADKTLRKLLNYLQLSASSDILDDMIERASFRFRSGRQQGEEDPHSFLRKGVVGDWNHHFGQEEKEIFKEVAGHMLIRLGYESNEYW
jgi:hypothetical protein